MNWSTSLRAHAAFCTRGSGAEVNGWKAQCGLSGSPAATAQQTTNHPNTSSARSRSRAITRNWEGKITRVGGDKDINVDVRVIAATNKDLLKEVDEKNFRLDLYHRLSVIIIHVPSLNERKDDIPLLIDKFMQDICSDYGIARKGIDEEAIRALQEYNWTGNIRELRNVVERLIILSSKSISREDVASYVLPKI